jgi:hypothetical protein
MGPAQKRSSTGIVLVPGAWFAPDAWGAVAELLRADGHPVSVTHLTGSSLADDNALGRTRVKNGSPVSGTVLTQSVTRSSNRSSRCLRDCVALWPGIRVRRWPSTRAHDRGRTASVFL